jgi:hypothetical protein
VEWDGFGGVCIVCSRLLSCSRVICLVCVVVIVECVLSYYCSICFVCTVVALLVVLRRWPFHHSMFHLCFSICVVLRHLLEYCPVAWVLGDVVMLIQYLMRHSEIFSQWTVYYPKIRICVPVTLTTLLSPAFRAGNRIIWLYMNVREKW